MSSNPISAQNWVDKEGRPSGGEVNGTGLWISWQNGPLGRIGTDERIAPNGAFVEDVLKAALQRIEFYNEGQFRCRENSLAITKVEEALHWLQARTQRRVVENVEGTHEGS